MLTFTWNENYFNRVWFKCVSLVLKLLISIIDDSFHLLPSFWSYHHHLSSFDVKTLYLNGPLLNSKITLGTIVLYLNKIPLSELKQKSPLLHITIILLRTKDFICFRCHWLLYVVLYIWCKYIPLYEAVQNTYFSNPTWVKYITLDIV